MESTIAWGPPVCGVLDLASWATSSPSRTTPKTLVPPRSSPIQVIETDRALALGLPHLVMHAAIPVEDEVLPLGVAHHPLPVAAELRIMGRQQHQPGHRPLAELLDDVAVAEVGVDPPVGSDRAQIDDADVPARRLWLLLFLRRRDRHGRQDYAFRSWPLRGRAARATARLRLASRVARPGWRLSTACPSCGSTRSS